MKRWLIIGIVVVVAGVGLLALRWIRTSETGPRYRTVKVERGDLVQAVKETVQDASRFAPRLLHGGGVHRPNRSGGSGRRLASGG